MAYVSTRGQAPPATLPEALFRGLAPDGGLYMPASLPVFSPDEIHALSGHSWPDTAVRIAIRLFGEEMDPDTVREVVLDALDFPVPVTPLTEGISLLDLTRGPTLAFKDVGARFMARLMAHFRPRGGTPLTVLTATSGDTGGAVAHAFLGLPGIRVVVLFPEGKVSPRQERQFSTLGGNVLAVAVQGDFDDCQRMAKAAFRDLRLREEVSLTSANSINVGRFLPQSFYYFHARAAVLGKSGAPEHRGKGAPGKGRGSATAGPASGDTPPVLFSVPSGNFGNVAAGLMARAMGLSGVRFLAATNANDGVPKYLETGLFRPRPSIPTLSTAMDVGDPSNLDRILHLYSGSHRRLVADLSGRSVSDAETRETIRRVRDRTGVILDPHSAVGFAALEREMEGGAGTVGILVATASPAKFAEVVEPILGEALPIPPALTRGLEADRRVVRLPPDFDALRGLLLEELPTGDA